MLGWSSLPTGDWCWCCFVIFKIAETSQTLVMIHGERAELPSFSTPSLEIWCSKDHLQIMIPTIENWACLNSCPANAILTVQGLQWIGLTFFSCNLACTCEHSQSHASSLGLCLHRCNYRSLFFKKDCLELTWDFYTADMENMFDLFDKRPSIMVGLSVQYWINTRSPWHRDIYPLGNCYTAVMAIPKFFKSTLNIAPFSAKEEIAEVIAVFKLWWLLHKIWANC